MELKNKEKKEKDKLGQFGYKQLELDRIQLIAELKCGLLSESSCKPIC